MSKSTIPLAKGFNASKLKFPVFVSEKYDGVPVRIDINAPSEGDWSAAAQTRQGEPLPSVDTYLEEFVTALMRSGFNLDCPMTFVAEITHETLTSFKDISGVVRRQEPQEDLVFNFFDMTVYTLAGVDEPFKRRSQMLCNILKDMPEHFRYAPQAVVVCEKSLALWMEPDMHKDVEGYIARSWDALWKPGTRHWDYQKLVVDPTVDLWITGFEEAVSADGTPLGMVGRVIANYQGAEIGVGPGKLTHAERKALWASHGTHLRNGPRIATIKYKRDPSYAALRQPTFQHWRPEKTESSYE